ncbi:MAG: LolA-related protein [Halothiobacillus sp.]
MMRRRLFMFLLAGFFWPLRAPAEPLASWNAATVLQSVANHRQSAARFTEEKFIGLLDTPLLSEGKLTFRPPDYLKKHTTAPRDEVMIIQGTVLTYTRQGQTYTLNLAEHPEATAYANSMRGLLTGNAAMLKQSYALKLSGDPAHWTLLLLPTDARIASLIKNISVTGAGDSVQMIEYDQTNGDRSVITIQPASPSAP